MMYSYPFTLCRRAVVATMDLSAKNIHMFATDHWLSNSQNVLLLRLDAPAWVADGVAAASPHRPMEAWTVEEVATWLEGLDMAGPAAHFRSQGVSGKDMVEFQSHQDLSRDLGVTAFLARKVFALRVQHLAAQQ